MADLQAWYRTAIRPRLEELRAALDALPGEAGHAAVLRVAHALKGSGGTFGFPAISDAAFAVEEAPPAELRAAAEALLHALESVAAPDPSPERVVVIDDDVTIAHLLSEKLVARGYEVQHAASAAEARRLLRAPAGLVILDLVLPDGDGRALLRELRERVETVDTPVLVLSGGAAPRVRAECKALGADEVFEKPFEAADVLAAVEARLARAPASTTLDALTGLPNRAGLLEALQTGARNWRSLALVEVDRLVDVNAAAGPAAGDALLRRIAATLREFAGPQESVARWGGDGFVLCLVSEPAPAAERLRRVLAQSAHALGVSCSAGLARFDRGAPLEEVTADADRALARARQGGAGHVALADDAHGPALEVLIAEDDPLVASVVSHRLGREGYRVQQFADGAAAFHATKGQRFALAILDVKMPGMDGFEVLRRLRSDARHARMPVILLTAMGNEADVVRGFELGADDYVLKPFSPSELVARVNRLLARA